MVGTAVSQSSVVVNMVRLACSAVEAEVVSDKPTPLDSIRSILRRHARNLTLPSTRLLRLTNLGVSCPVSLNCSLRLLFIGLVVRVPVYPTLLDMSRVVLLPPSKQSLTVLLPVDLRTGPALLAMCFLVGTSSFAPNVAVLPHGRPVGCSHLLPISFLPDTLVRPARFGVLVRHYRNSIWCRFASACSRV